MNQLDFNDRCAVITGGATGLGYAIAQRLLGSGGRVCLWDRDAPALARACAELGPQASSVTVDVSDHAGVVAAVKVSSCSTSLPPPNAPSAPKSTSFTRNTAGAAVASGVQMSMWNVVIDDASICCEVNSMPANTRLLYFLVAFPAICTSVRSALSQSADHVSTVRLVYALLKSEITLLAAAGGVGAASVGPGGGGGAGTL